MKRAQKERYLAQAIVDLALKREKMAFLSGPRQSGKTTLATMLTSQFDQSSYSNWDDTVFKKMWSKNPRDVLTDLHLEDVQQTRLLILDEIHKAPLWKGKLKGLYDLYHDQLSIIVTGSARLNVFKKGGDSLMGRYYNFRLHPFSLRESLDQAPLSPHGFFKNVIVPPTKITHDTIVKRLFLLGGFPEPFLSHDEKIARLWRKGRNEKIVREDIRDLTRIPELSRIETMVALLPERVGSLFSLTSLREDLDVSVDTVKRWLHYLSELYYVYAISPYSKNIKRSLKKEPKIYLYDWAEVENEGVRFENMTASHLLKACHFWSDTGEGDYQLHFLRDKEKREVDFLVTQNKKPWFTVECKLHDTQLDSTHDVFSSSLKIPHFQLCLQPNVFRKIRPGVFVMSFEYFFKEMV